MKKMNKKKIEEIKAKIEQAIEKTREYRNTHSLTLSCAQYHTGTINGYMRALDIIKEVENDKNKQ